VGLRAAPRSSGPDHSGEGAGWRAPGGRLRDHPPKLGEVLGRGDHGSTFAGAPIAAAAALAGLDVIDDPALLRRVRELGARFIPGVLD